MVQVVPFLLALVAASFAASAAWGTDVPFKQPTAMRYNLDSALPVADWPLVERTLEGKTIMHATLASNGNAWFLTSESDLICCMTVHDLTNDCSVIASNLPAGSFLASTDVSSVVAVAMESGKVTMYGGIAPCSDKVYERKFSESDVGTIHDVHFGKNTLAVASGTGLQVLNLQQASLFSWKNVCDGTNDTVAPVFSVACADDRRVRCGCRTVFDNVRADVPKAITP